MAAFANNNMLPVMLSKQSCHGYILNWTMSIALFADAVGSLPLFVCAPVVESKAKNQESDLVSLVLIALVLARAMLHFEDNGWLM